MHIRTLFEYTNDVLEVSLLLVDLSVTAHAMPSCRFAKGSSARFAWSGNG